MNKDLFGFEDLPLVKGTKNNPTICYKFLHYGNNIGSVETYILDKIASRRIDDIYVILKPLVYGWFKGGSEDQIKDERDALISFAISRLCTEFSNAWVSRKNNIGALFFSDIMRVKITFRPDLDL